MNVERLIEQLQEAEDLRFQDPWKAVLTAEASLDKAAALDREKLGDRKWFALQVDAWSILGSALRAVGDLWQAESALMIACGFLEAPEANADPRTYARLARRAANLRFDQSRFDEALELVAEAITIYDDYDEEQLLAAAQADRGLFLGAAGRREEGILCLDQALKALDPQQDFREFLSAVHNMAVQLHDDAADPETDRLARGWLKLADRCHALLPEKVSLLKLRTLEGLTAIRQGDLKAGSQDLEEALAGFTELGTGYEQAIILLHRAAAYLAQGNQDEVKRVAGQLFPFFRSLAIDREASAALIMFCKAAQSETATADVIKKAEEALRKAHERSLQLD